MVRQRMPRTHELITLAACRYTLDAEPFVVRWSAPETLAGGGEAILYGLSHALGSRDVSAHACTLVARDSSAVRTKMGINFGSRTR